MRTRTGSRNGSRLAKLALVVFSLYVVMLLINNQVSYNQAQQRTAELQERYHHQHLVNAGIKARSELDSDSEARLRYIMDIAHNRLNLVRPNDIIFVDVGR